MITLAEAKANIGRGVIYRQGWGDVEQGTISSTSSKFVFVRYQGDIGSKATRPEDLSWPEAARGGDHG